MCQMLPVNIALATRRPAELAQHRLVSTLSWCARAQAKLKDEYDRMEEKLRVMEERLRNRATESETESSVVSVPTRASNGSAR